MTRVNVDVICRADDQLGESPLWDHRAGRLLWVDILRGLVHSWSPQEGARELLRVDALVGAVALMGDSNLLLATTGGLLTWSSSTGAVELFGNPLLSADVRFNDGRVDVAGRFWVGTMARDPARYSEPLGALYRVDPDGRAQQMEHGLTISNGLDWSADGRTLYLTDTMRQVIYAYDFDAHAGTIANRRVFVSTAESSGYPDGLVVDSCGDVWSAHFAGSCLCRYDTQGRLIQRLGVDVSCPTAIAFGDRGLGTAFVTTSSHTLTAAEREPNAGSLLRLSLQRTGRPAFVFGSGVPT